LGWHESVVHTRLSSHAVAASQQNIEQTYSRNKRKKNN
jgi:hypothetical protein